MTNIVNTKRTDNTTNQALGQGKTISMRNWLNIIFKHKYIIISVFLSIFVTVVIGVLISKPVFQASSKVLVEKELDHEKSLLFRMNLNLTAERYDWLKSEIEIITSDPVVKQVIEVLRLDQTERKGTDLNELLKVFKSRLKIETMKDSNVLTISYESEDPALVAAIVNSLVNSYVDFRSHLFSETSDYQFFDGQIRVAEQKLSQMEERQVQFKQSEEIISPEAQSDILFARIAEFEKALTQVRTERIGKEAMLRVIKEKMLTGNTTNIPVTETSNSLSREKYIAKLRGELLDLELRRDQLLQKYSPEYEEIVNLDQAILNTRKHIEKEINEILELEETAIRALMAEEQALQGTINDLTNQIKEFAQKEYELTQLSRGIEDNREIYSMLLKQREEARISQAKLERGVRIKVISPARIPSRPIRPNRTMNILFAAVLGLVSGFGVAVTREYFDHTFNSPEDVALHLGLPVWGSIKIVNMKSVV